MTWNEVQLSLITLSGQYPHCDFRGLSHIITQKSSCGPKLAGHERTKLKLIRRYYVRLDHHISCGRFDCGSPGLYGSSGSGSRDREDPVLLVPCLVCCFSSVRSKSRWPIRPMERTKGIRGQAPGCWSVDVFGASGPFCFHVAGCRTILN